MRFPHISCLWYMYVLYVYFTSPVCIGTDLMLAIDLLNKRITRKENFKKYSHILFSDARFTRWRESRNLLSVWECSESSNIGWYGWFEADCECNGTTRYLLCAVKYFKVYVYMYCDYGNHFNLFWVNGDVTQFKMIAHFFFPLELGANFQIKFVHINISLMLIRFFSLFSCWRNWRGSGRYHERSCANSFPWKIYCKRRFGKFHFNVYIFF